MPDRRSNEVSSELLNSQECLVNASDHCQDQSIELDSFSLQVYCSPTHGKVIFVIRGENEINRLSNILTRILSQGRPILVGNFNS